MVVLWESEAESLQAGQLQAARLRQLYTAHVIPDKLLALTAWVPATGGDALLRTVVANGADKAVAKLRAVEQRLEFFLSHCLVPDSHPTLIRFFTFRACVDRMLIMAWFNVPQLALAVNNSARDHAQKRIQRIRKFFGKSEAAQALRRASLVLQLSGGVEALMSREPTADEVPTIVRLNRLQ